MAHHRQLVAVERLQAAAEQHPAQQGIGHRDGEQVGAGVAVSGMIGFVGLVVPHLIRLWFGPNHRVLLPASALLGALLLILADLVSRTIIVPAELPIGIVTAVLGGPFFLYLLLRDRKMRRLP